MKTLRWLVSAWKRASRMVSCRISSTGFLPMPLVMVSKLVTPGAEDEDESDDDEDFRQGEGGVAPARATLETKRPREGAGGLPRGGGRRAAGEGRMWIGKSLLPVANVVSGAIHSSGPWTKPHSRRW